MKIVVAGGSGFIGEPLVKRLTARGDDVAVLSRNPAKVRAGRGVQWDGKSAGEWTGEVDDADAIINLAGENIGEGRWTETRKRKLVDSRLNATNALVDALSTKQRTANREARTTFISASAVGYYGYDRDDELDESSRKGTGFLADLSDSWETAAKRAEGFTRLVILRFGVVLAADGGALQKMMLPFRFGAGGRVGDCMEWMSWIDRDDLLDAIEWSLRSNDVRGIYNVTSPQPVRNRDFATQLGQVMHRPSFLPAPSFALRLLFGDMAEETLLGGQRVVPRRAQAEGFRFAHGTLDSALRNVINR